MKEILLILECFPVLKAFTSSFILPPSSLLLQAWFGVGHDEIHDGVAWAGVFVEVRHVGAKEDGIACAQLNGVVRADGEAHAARVDDQILIRAFGMRVGALKVSAAQA